MAQQKGNQVKTKPSDFLAEGWTQHCYARDSRGYETSIFSPTAVEWDLLGAIYKVYSGSVAGDIIRYVLHNLPPVSNGGKYARTIVEWNDPLHRSKDEVLTVLRHLGL